MACPQSYEYNEAIQNLAATAGDEELRYGEPALDALGVPSPCSGGFANVYKVHCPQTGKTWAVKCFTREVRGRAERYRQIAEHLARANLPFMVAFQYLQRGLRIHGQWQPVVKMRWVEGLALHRFVAEHADRPKNLKLLLELWSRLATRLRDSGTAHANLRHGNVLLVPAAGGALKLRLIDYDGMWVPALAGQRSAELGHLCYQHPQRLREGLFNAEVDRFSHLAIYTAIRCAMAGRGELWQRFHNGENLLFTQDDYRQPSESDAFRACWKLADAEVRALLGRLVLACGRRLEEVPWLDQVLDGGRAVPLSRGEEREAAALLGATISPPSPGKGRSEGAIPGPLVEAPPLPRAEPEPAAGVVLEMGRLAGVSPNTSPLPQRQSLQVASPLAGAAPPLGTTAETGGYDLGQFDERVRLLDLPPPVVAYRLKRKPKSQWPLFAGLAAGIVIMYVAAAFVFWAATQRNPPMPDDVAKQGDKAPPKETGPRPDDGSSGQPAAAVRKPLPSASSKGTKGEEPVPPVDGHLPRIAPSRNCLELKSTPPPTCFSQRQTRRHSTACRPASTFPSLIWRRAAGPSPSDQATGMTPVIARPTWCARMVFLGKAHAAI